MTDSVSFPTESEIRTKIVEYGRRLYEHGYVVTNDGNISARVSEDEIIATPTGVSKGFMNEDMLVRMRLDGTVVERGSRAPSSEIKMHLRVYQENPSVMGVVHAHPVYATSFAIAGIPLDQSILSEAMLQIGAIGVAHYAEPGTYDVPDSIAPFCKDYAAVLMSNHGALSWGTSLDEAYTRMEVLENYARISYVVRQLGGGRQLSAEQVEGLARLRGRMGLAPVMMPAGGSEVANGTDVMPAARMIRPSGEKGE